MTLSPSGKKGTTHLVATDQSAIPRIRAPARGSYAVPRTAASALSHAGLHPP